MNSQKLAKPCLAAGFIAATVAASATGVSAFAEENQPNTLSDRPMVNATSSSVKQPVDISVNLAKQINQDDEQTNAGSQSQIQALIEQAASEIAEPIETETSQESTQSVKANQQQIDLQAQLTLAETQEAADAKQAAIDAQRAAEDQLTKAEQIRADAQQKLADAKDSSPITKADVERAQ